MPPTNSGNIEIYFATMQCLQYLIDSTVSIVTRDNINEIIKLAHKSSDVAASQSQSQTQTRSQDDYSTRMQQEEAAGNTVRSLVLYKSTKQKSCVKRLTRVKRRFAFNNVLIDVLKQQSSFVVVDFKVQKRFDHKISIYSLLEPYLKLLKLVSYLNNTQKRLMICEKNSKSVALPQRNTFLSENLKKYFHFLYLYKLYRDVSTRIAAFRGDNFISFALGELVIYKTDINPPKKIHFKEIVEVVEDGRLSQMKNIDSNIHEDYIGGTQAFPIVEDEEEFQQQQFNFNNFYFDSKFSFQDEIPSYQPTQPFSIYFNTQPFIYKTQQSDQQPIAEVDVSELTKATVYKTIEQPSSPPPAQLQIADKPAPSEPAEEDEEAPVVEQLVPSTADRKAKKRRIMSVGLSKRQRFSKHLHSKVAETN